MKKKHIGLLIFLNLLIALGYFFENKEAGYTQLSSDLHNSIPVCYKIDDPSLFQNDLYLFNVEVLAVQKKINEAFEYFKKAEDLLKYYTLL